MMLLYRQAISGRTELDLFLEQLAAHVHTAAKRTSHSLFSEALAFPTLIWLRRWRCGAGAARAPTLRPLALWLANAAELLMALRRQQASDAARGGGGGNSSGNIGGGGGAQLSLTKVVHAAFSALVGAAKTRLVPALPGLLWVRLQCSHGGLAG